MTDEDCGGIIPDVDETFAFMGAALIACGASLAGIAIAALTAWMVLR